MSHEASFRRKIMYVAAIALLLIPLYRLGQPATRSGPGGKLAQLRTEYDLSQAELGEIDPASESMRLASLGMRGIAANLLWSKSLEYDKKEDWDSLRVTLNQITKLQPNFIKVWEFQAHNLSYNISVEFDDYRHRYHWVKKGISFLIDGTRHNRDNPRLLHYTGWITGQKIGRADEHVQFRQMFRADSDFHNEINSSVVVDDAAGYDGRPDNWLVGRLWYQRAQRSVDIKGMPLRGKSPLLFHADPEMSLINYSWNIEDEGILGEVAQRAWKTAGNAWISYGQRQIPTSWGHSIRLGDLQSVKEDSAKMLARLDELAPGVRTAIFQEKVATLSPQERAALDLKQEEIREDAQYRLHGAAQLKTHVTNLEVAQRAPPANRDKALRMASRVDEHDELGRRISQYQSTVNYQYWDTRCKAEQTKAAVEARGNLFLAKQAHKAARLEEARGLYEKAWALWRQVFNEYPRLMDDVTAEELVESVKHYQRLLSQLELPLPEDFLLREFMERRHEKLDAFFGKPAATPGEPKKVEAAKPATGDSKSAEEGTAKPVDPDRPPEPDDAGSAETGKPPAANPAADESPPEPADSPATDAPAKSPG